MFKYFSLNMTSTINVLLKNTDGILYISQNNGPDSDNENEY